MAPADNAAPNDLPAIASRALAAQKLTTAESRIRELPAFCNLPFEPACMEFHQTTRVVRSAASAGQVRQPLRPDTARATRHGTLLDPLRDLPANRTGSPSPPRLPMGNATAITDACQPSAATAVTRPRATR